MTNQSQHKFRFSQDSAYSRTTQMYQIQPFEIEQKSLTHKQVNKMIQNWDTFGRIQQKFPIWSFNFEYQKIPKIAPQEFYKFAIHYVLLKKLSVLIKDFDQSELLKKSYQLKEIYKLQSLAGKLKGRKFDYLLLVTVKLIGFFFGSHTRQIIINQELQSQIYTILVYVLLGTQVGQKTFSALIDKYKKKPSLKYNRSSSIFKRSLIPTDLNKKTSEHKQKLKTTARSKKRIGRCQCRTGTALFHQIPDDVEDDKYTEMKQLLKANLVVKEFVPGPKPKQTLDEVLTKAKKPQIKIEQLRQAKNMQKKQMKHKKLFYTQMSSSLDLSRNNESLNLLHNHSINIKPEKKSKYYQMLKKQDLKIPSMHIQSEIKLPKLQKPKQIQVYNYHAMVQKKMQGNYWKNIISQMKENRFQNIEHFPPISAKMYFKQDELDEDKKKSRVSETIDVMQTENLHQKQQKRQDHAEFITEKVVQTPRQATKDLQTLQTMSKLTKKPTQLKKKKTSIRSVLQQRKDQINIIEYSTVTNVKQIYKEQRAFMNVYSNEPIDDFATKLKKKSYVQLKQVEKKFYQDCVVRQEKIDQTYFA